MLDYGKYITVADRFQRKAKWQDREDLNHTIILSLAQAQLRLDRKRAERCQKKQDEVERRKAEQPALFQL